MIYENLPSFEKDFTRLSKKFKTLENDFKTLKKYHIEVFHDCKIKTDNPIEIQGACSNTFKSYKVRKFACKSLFGRGRQSGLRLIYVHQPNINKITFIEIYFKADQKNEDKPRLKKFISNL